MKAFVKKLLCLCIMASLLVSGCGKDVTGDDPVVPSDTGPADTPAENSAKHDILITEIDSVLAENQLGTNLQRYLGDAAAYHGGQQMRVCHTGRGTYTAFVQDFGEESAGGLQKFYVAKTDAEGLSALLYYGEFESDDATVTVNIGQDQNGDVWAVASSPAIHNAVRFDRDTDDFTEYTVSTVFASGETPGYSQTMFDFENRRIYVFHNGIFGSGRYLLEWYTFDIDTKTWSDTSIYKWIDDTYRHVYLYPFADGNGGAYIVGLRGDSKFAAEGKPQAVNLRYAWDQLDLFFIPDLTSTDNITFTTIQPVYDERVDEGIWSYIYTQTLDVYVDMNGYMHVSYRYQLSDVAGLHPELDTEVQYRHAVYKGMECIFNEKLDFMDTEHPSFRPMIRQSTDGKLHLISARIDGEIIELDFYSARDELGQSWKHEKHIGLDEGVTTSSFSLSACRDGSVQDNTVSAFFYGYCGLNKTAYTFNISLDDYSVSELVDILEGYDIMIDWRIDKRIPYDDRCAQAVSTENGTYALIVYNYDFESGTEYYHIVKMDSEGNAVILVSDSYETGQGDKHVTMSCSGGTVYVGLTDGRHAYFIDTETDEVSLRELTPVLTFDLVPRQMSIVPDPESGNIYCLSVLDTDDFALSCIPVDREKKTVSIRNAVRYSFDRALLGNYENVYPLSDGKGGAYLAGTRSVTEEQLGGMLEYTGHKSPVNDSVMLFYIPSLSESTEVRCIEVQSPYEDEGSEGIWSSVRVKDVYMASDGRLNVIYSVCHFDYDDGDRKTNPELVSGTLKHYRAVYDGTELVSAEVIEINGLEEDTSVRMAETDDGTVYLITCNLINTYLMDYGLYEDGQEAVLTVYGETCDGWTKAAEKALGDFAADGLFVCDSAVVDAVDCLVYASSNDVYHVIIYFEERS